MELAPARKHSAWQGVGVGGWVGGWGANVEGPLNECGTADVHVTRLEY
jgi:hypothetical protein